MRQVLIAVLLGAVGLSACAGPGPREREAVRLAEYEQFAGAPVDEFHFWRMDRWESLGPLTVAIWSEPGKAWLIRVRKPCPGLEFAQIVGVSSTLNRVNRNFDTVNFEGMRCRIAELRPIDVKAMRAARREQAAND